jgi:hypothetical protein
MPTRCDHCGSPRIVPIAYGERIAETVLLELDEQLVFVASFWIDGIPLWQCLDCNESLETPRSCTHPQTEAEHAAMREYDDAVRNLYSSIRLPASVPPVLDLYPLLEGLKCFKELLNSFYEFKASAVKVTQVNGARQVLALHRGKWFEYDLEPPDAPERLIEYCEYKFRRNHTSLIDIEFWRERKEHHCIMSAECTNTERTYYFRFKDETANA